MPILDIQKRNTEAGRIRAGDKDARGNPRKGKNWRLTSRDEVRLTGAAKEWGGKVQPWEGREGEFELYTSTDTLPIILVPGYLATTWYEQWTAAGCQRRCDGVHNVIADAPCMCDPDDRECGPHTRLSVMLPDLPGIGMWLVQSTGWNAAAELSAANDILDRASVQGIMLPARLILEQREQRKPGSPVRKFVVPTLDISVTMRSLMPPSTAGELPAAPSHEPAAAGVPSGVSVGDGLAAVQREREALPRANAAEPIGNTIGDVEPGASPDAPAESAETGPSDTSPSGETGDPGATAGAGLGEHEPAPSADTGDDGVEPQAGTDTQAPATVPDPPPPPRRSRRGLATKPQLEALNSLYGQLKEPLEEGQNPAVTIGGLYAWTAKERGLDVDVMIASLEETPYGDDMPRDADGHLHFPALRDSLSKAEASAMIDGMQGLQAKREATAS